MRNSCFPCHLQYNACVNVSQYLLRRFQQYISIVSSEYMKKLPIAFISPCSPRSGPRTAKPFELSAKRIQNRRKPLCFRSAMCGSARSRRQRSRRGKRSAAHSRWKLPSVAPRAAIGGDRFKQGNGVRRAPRVSGGVPRRRQSRRHGKPGAVPQPSPPLAGRRAKRAGAKQRSNESLQRNGTERQPPGLQLFVKCHFCEEPPPSQPCGS